MSKKKKTTQTEPVQSAADAEAIETMDSALDAVSDEGAENTALEADTAEAPAQPAGNDIADTLAATKAKANEYLLMAQRVQADFENFRKRNKDVRREAFDDGARAFATTLLPVLDNMERAITAASASTDTSLKEGVEMVWRQLNDAFAKRGITTIDRKGEAFDPNLENAVLQGTDEDGAPGTVCEVLQKGYQMDGFVLRHAMVKVVPD